MEPHRLTDELKEAARRLGFPLVGACPAVAPPGYPRLLEWLERGYAGQMAWIGERRASYAHPRHVLEGVRSLLMLGLPYRTASPRGAAVGEGRVSQYAWGAADYHDLVHDRLKQLRRELTQRVPAACARGVVDTAPLMEREFAQLAGLGWIGKNTLLLSRTQGSYFFLAALLTDVELAYDASTTDDHCGTCTACLDHCPTQAFPQAYVLDASRCISYLTIELRDAVPPPLRESMGAWVFGCDVCQQVCPWNRRAPESREAALRPQPDRNPLELAGLFFLDDEALRRRFRRTPLWRARRRGLLRNAAIALGNRPAAEALPALLRGLEDLEPLVRGACAWALGRYDDPRTAAALSARLVVEKDVEVRQEIAAALDRRKATTSDSIPSGATALPMSSGKDRHAGPPPAP